MESLPWRDGDAVRAKAAAPRALSTDASCSELCIPEQAGDIDILDSEECPPRSPATACASIISRPASTGGKDQNELPRKLTDAATRTERHCASTTPIATSRSTLRTARLTASAISETARKRPPCATSGPRRVRKVHARLPT